jgi:Oxygen-sensitive ribonucleoside-triphosphate reductase
MARIERLNGVKARVAPILYMEGACGVRLQADDDVSEIFKHGRASISLGFIGVHETINALFGDKVHVFDDEVLRQKGVAIVQNLRDAVEEWKAETGYGFSLYSTPSENLCSRFCNLDTKEFGLVDGVTEKGYYTNSYHLDVEKKVDPYAKLNFEMAYRQSPAVVLFATANIQTFSTIWKRWKTSGITATAACLITAPIRRLMNVTSAAIPVNLIVPARALPARNVAIMTQLKSSDPPCLWLLRQPGCPPV